MPSNNPYDAVPDIDFVPETTEEILEELVDTYEQVLSEETGQTEKLPVSSREKIILNTMAYELSVLAQLFNDRAKQNLPKYSRGDFLEVLASFWGLTRRQASPALGEAEFTLSAVREDDILIPKGTRVSPGDKLFFETDEDLISIPDRAGGDYLPAGGGGWQWVCRRKNQYHCGPGGLRCQGEQRGPDTGRCGCGG